MPLEDGSPSYLDKIVAQRRLDVAAAKASVSEDALRAQIAAQSPVHDFVAALRRQELAVLAEMKRASPSKGDIAVGVDAAQQGLTYALAGACTVSVLTCPTGFKGSLDDMARVRRGLDEAALEPPVCVLRKDFVIDAYQLLEARAHGADTALLIVNILSADELAALMAASRALGMEPLVEVNTEAEMTVALAAGAKVIGVNNRNLHTFKVDMGTTVRLAAMVPPASGIELLALSGVGSRDDALSFARAGARAVLVGESLMRASSPAALIAELHGRAAPPPLCKVCGVRTAEAAAVAVAAGADFVGMIFAPSKRQVSEAEAKEIVGAVRANDAALAAARGPRWRLPAKIAAIDADGAAGGDDGAPTRRWLQLWQGLLEHAARRGGPLTVGVFVNATVAEMNGVAERVGLDLIQLHGDEGWEVARELVRPAVRVVHMEAGVDAAAVGGQLRGGHAAAVLLDSKGGGTGKSFDWDVGAEVQRNAPFILAGGLRPDNVADAVARVRPWCVDVSSGVESDGAKDNAKIEAFVKNAKHAAAA